MAFLPFYQVSADAKIALQQFSLEFSTTLAAAPAVPWAQMLGHYNQSKAIQTTYPIPLSTARYERVKGDDKMRRLYARSLRVQPELWTDGIEEFRRVVEAPDFTGWANEPARIAIEAMRQPNLLAATMLEANPVLDFYFDKDVKATTGQTLFHATHPANVLDSSFGTFSNDLSGYGSTLNQDVLKAVFTSMATRPAPNGRVMGLTPTHVLTDMTAYQTCKDFLESDLMRVAFLEGGAGSQKNTNFNTFNRWKNSIELIGAPELTAGAGYLYFVDASPTAPKPWCVQDGGAPEEVIFDTSSDYYKQTKKIGIKYTLELSVTAMLAQGITRVLLA